MADWENNSQHSDHSGNSLDNNLCLFEDRPAWKQKQHLASCCPICQGPYTYYIYAEDIDDNLEERRECAGCGKRACPECLEGCTECLCHCDWENDRAVHGYPRNTVKLVAKESYGGACGEWVCASIKWHDDTAAATEEVYHGGCACILHHRKVRARSSARSSAICCSAPRTGGAG